MKILLLVNYNIEMGFCFKTIKGVEKLLWETFLTSLFFGKYKYLPPIIRTFSMIPVKKYVIGLQYSVILAKDKYLILLCASRKLIGSVTGERSFFNHQLPSCAQVRNM